MKAIAICLVAVTAFHANAATLASPGALDSEPTPILSGEGRAPNLTYYNYPYNRFGDCNGDGWCNFGDLVALIACYGGTGPMVCMPAGDMDNDEAITLFDIVILLLWLAGHPDAVPPPNDCDWEVPEIQTAGNITLDYCIGGPGETVYVGAYVQTPLMSSFHFSLAYDNQDIEEIFASDMNPDFITSYWTRRGVFRENMPPENDDTLSTITFSLACVNDEGQVFDPLEFPELTWAFDIGVVISPGSSEGHHLLLLESDNIYGPPMFFSEDGWTSYEFNSSGPVCVYTPGDCNHNGTPLELNDVVAMIGLYRGSIAPGYLCACPPHGDYLVPQADPNGNCVPFELGDVVTEIGAYRGTSEASGCEDCPGSR
jgi:hypothetical protein